jgi:hypothetical protein
MLKDKSGIDLEQLTPRPNWKRLITEYDAGELVDTGKIFIYPS